MLKMNMKTLIITIATALMSISCSNTPKKMNTENNTSKKILFVLTSHDKLGDTGEKTGFWIEEFAAPYYFLKDKGYDITLSSPEGGQPPIDPRSKEEGALTVAAKRYLNDKETQKLLSNTIQLKLVNAVDFDAIFYPGGHGPLWDLANDKNSIQLIETFYKQDKPIASVCHAPAIFKYTKSENGAPLVKGKKLTGFSNTEEEAIHLMEVVPFTVENMLEENGAIYSKGENWSEYVVEDGILITGQNPASSELVAKKLAARLQ